jgi:hypothetical protein
MTTIDELIRQIDCKLIHPMHLTANHSSSRKYMMGVYKQLAKSRKGKQAQGEYRWGVESFPEEAHKLIAYFTHRLELFGYEHHAARLKAQYNFQPAGNPHDTLQI